MEINKFKLNGKTIEIEAGTRVEANPTDSATETLHAIKIDDVAYNVNGSQDKPLDTVYAENLSDGTTTKTMSSIVGLVGDDGKVPEDKLPKFKVAGVEFADNNLLLNAPFFISDGKLYMDPASQSAIDKRKSDYWGGYYRPITCQNVDYAVKASLCDGIGTEYTDAEKARARARIGAEEEWEFVDEIIIDEPDGRITPIVIDLGFTPRSAIIMFHNGTAIADNSGTGVQVQLLNPNTDKGFTAFGWANIKAGDKVAFLKSDILRYVPEEIRYIFTCEFKRTTSAIGENASGQNRYVNGIYNSLDGATQLVLSGNGSRVNFSNPILQGTRISIFIKRWDYVICKT